MANRIVLNETSYHGAGAISAIVDEAKARGYRKAFVCSDPDLVKFGVTGKVTALLEKAGLAYALYSDIKPNPTIQNVQTGVSAFQAAGADYIIAIGGGSSMDTAKAVGIIVRNPEFADVRSLEGVAPTKNPCVPIIAVPTTAGTAAEVTINYVITDVEKKRKFVCVDTHDIPVVAVVDPEMMASMPKGLTAATGMDALTHAIEGYITKAAWEMTDMFHLKAIELIAGSLRDAVRNTKEGREQMALAQYIAGMGFSMWDSASSIPWLTLSALCMIPLTVWPTPSCCRPLWNTMRRHWRKNTAPSPRPWGSRDRNHDAGGIPKSRRGCGAAALRRCGHPPPIWGRSSIGRISPSWPESAAKDACTPGNPKDPTIEDIVSLYESLL